ncbi:MAG: riboflavin synthase [Chitinispirillales bacterium]|nr:riboflavin synthase [Chitinispirillales bacterium]
MFTGLIETMGTIAGVRSCNRSVELCIVSGMPDYDVEIGGSVAIDGICLTVERFGAGGEMFFTAVSETLKRSTLDRVAPGRKVNLERAMRLDGRLDGHIVLGHVDAVGRIVSDEHIGVSVMRTIEVPNDLSMFIAEKGSIAVDGISLTIAKSGINTITLSLIPATIERTTMSTKKIGDTVNIECDVFARYIYRMIKMSGGSESLIDKMERLGF